MTHAPLSREEIARRDLGTTVVSPALARALTLTFLAGIVLIPAGQIVYAIARPAARAGVPAESRRQSADSVSRSPWSRLLAANAALIDRLQSVERHFERDCWLRKSL